MMAKLSTHALMVLERK